jgi:hypothetical protein
VEGVVITFSLAGDKAHSPGRRLLMDSKVEYALAVSSKDFCIGSLVPSVARPRADGTFKR